MNKRKAITGLLSLLVFLGTVVSIPLIFESCSPCNGPCGIPAWEDSLYRECVFTHFSLLFIALAALFLVSRKWADDAQKQ